MRKCVCAGTNRSCLYCGGSGYMPEGSLLSHQKIMKKNVERNNSNVVVQETEKIVKKPAPQKTGDEKIKHSNQGKTTKQKTITQKNYLRCPNCDLLILKTRMHHHMERHSSLNENIQLNSSKFKTKNDITQEIDFNKLELISHRGRRVNEEQRCSACNRIHSYVWEYSKSNQGRVFICNNCKPLVFSKSFGTEDHPYLVMMTNAVETNRRKH